MKDIYSIQDKPFLDIVQKTEDRKYSLPVSSCDHEVAEVNFLCVFAGSEHDSLQLGEATDSPAVLHDVLYQSPCVPNVMAMLILSVVILSHNYHPMHMKIFFQLIPGKCTKKDISIIKTYTLAIQLTRHLGPLSSILCLILHLILWIQIINLWPISKLLLGNLSSCWKPRKEM